MDATMESTSRHEPEDVAGLAEAAEHHPLPAAELRWRCDPANLSFETTADVDPETGVIGQADAVESLRFGLETDAPGQNIFVRGLIGTGRMTLVRRLLENIRPSCPLARDRCYVLNFDHPDRPRLISLPRGRGPAFRKRVDKLADFIRDDLGIALASQEVSERRAHLDRVHHAKAREITEPFEESIRDAGLALASFEAGPVTKTMLVPLIDGAPVKPHEFEAMQDDGSISTEQLEHYNTQREHFARDFQEVAQKIQDVQSAHDEAVQALLVAEARLLLDGLIRGIKREFPQPEVSRFLDDLADDVAEISFDELDELEDFTRRYRINVVLAHDAGDSCPIVIENVPTASNLLGTIDHQADADDVMHCDHLTVRAGSLLRADGGYLILDARDLLDEEGAWKALVRTLRSGCVEMAPVQSGMPLMPGHTVKPQPIDLRVRVILIGGSEIYHILDAHEADFSHLFKVLADFDTEIPREGGCARYARVLARIASDEKLLPFDREAVAALTEHGARIADHEGKLTTRFGRIADIAREGAFLASKERRKVVGAADIISAIKRSKKRSDLPARRFRALLAEGIIRVGTSGTVVGQINGLAVMTAGLLTFGFPARITAAIGPGRAGIINVERESDLSGSIHTKGVYILGGLLRTLLQTKHPLAFDASIAFEQSYGGIDGDSASGAEVCCLLSALTRVPLRQDLAMTGAIDQMGHILAVGAVNEKIEGFFDVCLDLGLTGGQGVIIPRANAGDLMLREDVVETCLEGRFRVFAVDTVMEALEILTSKRACDANERGEHPADTVLGVAVRRAGDFWRWSNPDGERGDPADPSRRL